MFNMSTEETTIRLVHVIGETKEIKTTTQNKPENKSSQQTEKGIL